MIGHLCWAGFAAVAFGMGAMLDRDDAAGAQEAKNAVPKSGVSVDRVGSGGRAGDGWAALGAKNYSFADLV